MQRADGGIPAKALLITQPCISHGARLVPLRIRNCAVPCPVVVGRSRKAMTDRSSPSGFLLMCCGVSPSARW